MSPSVMCWPLQKFPDSVIGYQHATSGDTTSVNFCLRLVSALPAWVFREPPLCRVRLNAQPPLTACTARGQPPSIQVTTLALQRCLSRTSIPERDDPEA